MISSWRSFVSGGEAVERPKKMKANQLVSGNRSRTVKGRVLQRASTIFTHQRTYATRFRPGIKNAMNHQPDIDAAWSSGNACSNGTNTIEPGWFPVFWQI